MSHVFQVTDEQYQTIEQAAKTESQTPDALFARWIEELRDRTRGSRYYETEEWFRHLGATEEQIAEAKRIAKERGDANS